MDIANGLEAQLALTRWQAPNLIPAVIEEDEEEIFLLPLEEPFMRFLPLQVAPDFAAIFQDPNPPRLRNQDIRPMPMKRQPSFEGFPEEWPEFSGLDYLGVQEHLVEEQDAPEPVEDIDDEEGSMDWNEASSQHIDVSLSTKRRDSMTDDDRLLQDVIDPSSPHVATIGLRDPAMPNAIAPEFGPVLERVPSGKNL